MEKYPVIDMIKTGQNIKCIMKMKDISVKDIQSFLGLSSPQSIYHWLNGKNLPTVDNLYALSDLFMMPIDRLICGSRGYQRDRNDVAYQRLLAYYQRLSVLMSNKEVD